MNTLRVLMIEDSQADAELITRVLHTSGRPVAIECVATAAALRVALSADRWDLILCDWSLPGFGGPDALAIFRDSGLDVPLIVVTGTITEELAVDAMRAGAHDLVLKDRLGRLVPAVERELREREARRARRAAELALRESEARRRLSDARFARLAESGIIGIAFADADANVYDANDAWLVTVGHTRAELAAGLLNWARMSPPECATADEEARRRLRASGVAPPWEKELIRKDGTRAPVLIGVAMLDRDDCIAFTADLSERKRAEAALRRSEEQLCAAQKVEALGRLAAGISHDFNNLLSIILMYTGVVLAALAADDPLRADLDEIQLATERAAALTRQLLTFSRRQVLQPRVLDVNETVAAMEKILRRALGEDIELRVDEERELELVKIDPSQLEQVLMNLAVNARDAMPRGGTLSIRTRNVLLDEAHGSARPGWHVLLSVTDTGVGMDAATQARAFEPFFTTKGVGEGTGLGLATVHGIIQQSGGAITVVSEPGRGTRFEIHLPVARTEPRTSVRLPALTDAATSGWETVLLVEDDPALRAVMRVILSRDGYHVLEAESAGDAVLICERHGTPIHLLLTDVVMPRMSGRELAERATQLRPDLHVLYVSGYTEDALIRHGVFEAEVAFLQKPITPEALRGKVRETLDAEPRPP